MSRQDLLRIFFDEAKRHLDAAVHLALSQTHLTRPEWNELFRALHSVKGMAGALGYDRIVQALHRAESTVDRMRQSELDDPPRRHAEIGLEVESVRDAIAAIERDPWLHEAPQHATRSVARALPSSRVEADRLDRLFEIALRLSSAQERLEHALGPAAEPMLLSARDEVQRAVRALRREVLELRLAPIEWIVPLLQEAAQRWARAQGVDVRLNSRTDGTRVDRQILEGMLDPLAQILRNAIVHGIEPPEQRRQRGKPTAGSLAISIERRGERLWIRVSDDGRGVSADQVIARAGELGWPVNEALAEPLMLLTLPGLTTSARLGLLAGRGIGLAAARDAVERLGGSLTIGSELGKGFWVDLAVPTRVAILPLFLVETAGHAMAIPVNLVREVRLAGKFKRAADRWGDQPAIPLIELMEPPKNSRRHPAGAALVIDGSSSLILVDRVIGRREMVCRPLGPPLDAIPYLNGAAVMPSGGVALVLDPNLLLRHCQQSAVTIGT
jgi:two-component system chemotaxis sensor kinase CheA